MPDRYREYKVISVSESGLSTLLFGSGRIPVSKMEEALNREARDGWNLVFQIVEQKRFMLFWTRETVIMTLGR